MFQSITGSAPASSSVQVSTSPAIRPNREKRELIAWMRGLVESGRLPDLDGSIADRVKREVQTIAALPESLACTIDLPTGPVAFEVVELRIVYLVTVAGRLVSDPSEAEYEYELRRWMDVESAGVSAHRGGPVSLPLFAKAAEPKRVRKSRKARPAAIPDPVVQ